MAERSPIQVLLLSATALLLMVGLVFVFSSSAAHAAKATGDATHFLKEHAARAAVGLMGLFVALHVPGPTLRKRALWIYLAAVVLCALVLVPGLGVVRGGARRWLVAGGVSLQPSELAKLALMIALAAAFARRELLPVADRKPLLTYFVLAQLPIVLVFAEPDMGTAVVLELLVLGMLFLAGLRWRYLALLAAVLIPVGYHLALSTPYRARRLMGFLDPWAYRQTIGYQVTESLIALGSGGLWGQGLGQGKHGLFFLPEAHTDFILAVVGQELGLAGVLAVVLAFFLLLVCGLKLARGAGDPFDRYLASGITMLVVMPALFNMAVVMGLLPPKGLPLPLVSYGGSQLMVTLMAVGLLLGVAQRVGATQEARR